MYIYVLQITLFQSKNKLII